MTSHILSRVPKSVETVPPTSVGTFDHVIVTCVDVFVRQVAPSVMQ
jgi:hypothetical protein